MTKKVTQARLYSCGRQSALGICAWFAATFEANELLPPGKKLTDEQILAEGKKEFPDRKVWESFDKKILTINAYRQQYNRGDFTGKIPPRKPSFRYNAKGIRVEARKGLRPLSPGEVKAITDLHILEKVKPNA